MSERRDKLEIKEFKLGMIKKFSSIVIIAKRGSGKSWICRDLINYFRDFPVGLIICPTEKTDKFYSDFFPEAYIHYEYKSSILEKLLARQLAIKEKKEYYIKNYKKRIDTRAYVIMDDCLADSKGWINDVNVKEVLYNGRHYDITYILTMQYPLGIPPSLRANFDYVFLLADDSYTNQEKMYKHYAGMFPKFPAFQEVYNALTVDYHSMVIVNRGARNSFLDKIYWYKARNMEPPYVGCPQFKKFNDNNFDPDWKKRNKLIGFDIHDYYLKKKNNKEKMQVEKVTERKRKN